MLGMIKTFNFLILCLFFFAFISCIILPNLFPQVWGDEIKSNKIHNNQINIAFDLGTNSENHSDNLKQNNTTINKIKVALLVPLTGTFTDEGHSILNASQLAFFELANDNLSLFPIDTGGTSEGALIAAKQAIDLGVNLIIGPLLSKEVSAIAPIARSKNINIISFSNDPNVAGSGVFLIGHALQEQVKRIIAYAIDQGHKKFAALLPDSRYGHTVLRHLRSAIITGEAELTHIQIYKQDASNAEGVVRELADYDRRRQALLKKRKSLENKKDKLSIRKLKKLETMHTLGDLDFDALLISDDPKILRRVVPLMPYFEIDPVKIQFLGLDMWDNAELLSEKSLVGGLYVAAEPTAKKNFISSYISIYNDFPLDVAALAYDATALAAVLFAQNNIKEFSEYKLTETRGFWGASGVFRFHKTGLSERNLAIIKVGEEKIRNIVDLPPKKFRQ